MPNLKFIALLLVAVLAGACSDMQENPRQTAGTLLGAAAGGLLGSQFGSGSGRLAATAVGVLGGAYLGGKIGRSLDDADRLRARQAHNQALNSGQQIRWDNPNSGNSGSVTPTRTGTDAQTGATCREYQTMVTVGGKTEQAYGTACQQPDGSWRIMN
jgi:surface antigen